MITKELETYVRDLVEQGYDRELIRTQLIKGGEWNRSDTVEVFNVIDGVGPPLENNNTIVSDKVIDEKRSQVIDEVVGVKQIVKGEKKTETQTTKELYELDENNHIVAILSLVGLIILLSAGAVFGYMKYFPQQEDLTPYEVFVAMGEVVPPKTARINAEFNMVGDVVLAPAYEDKTNQDSPAIQTPEKVTFNYGMEIGQVLDVTDSANPKLEGSVLFEMSGSYSFMNIDFNATVDFKLLDKIYIRLREVTPLPFLGNLEIMTNKWIAFDLDELDIVFNQQEEAKIQEDILKYFETLLVEEWVNKVVIVNEGDNIIGDIPTYYFTIQLTPEDWDMLIDGFAKGLEEFTADMSVDDKAFLFEQDVSVADLQELNNLFINGYSDFKETPEYQELLQALSLLRLETWIDKEEFYLQKMTLDFELNDYEFSDVLLNSTLSFTQENKEFNQPVLINTPDESVTLDEIQEIFNEQYQNQ